MLCMKTDLDTNIFDAATELSTQLVTNDRSCIADGHSDRRDKQCRLVGRCAAKDDQLEAMMSLDVFVVGPLQLFALHTLWFERPKV